MLNPAEGSANQIFTQKVLKIVMKMPQNNQKEVIKYSL